MGNKRYIKVNFNRLCYVDFPSALSGWKGSIVLCFHKSITAFNRQMVKNFLCIWFSVAFAPLNYERMLDSGHGKV